MLRMSAREMARSLGKTRRAVDCKVNKLGLPGERRRLLVESICQGARDGLSDYRLADLLGVCRNTVGKHRRAACGRS